MVASEEFARKIRETMSSLTGSFSDDSRLGGSTRPSDEDRYNHGLPSEEFESFSNHGSDLAKDSGGDSVPIFSSEHDPASQSPPSVHSAGGGSSNGPILAPPSEMEREEGYALREWRRQNALRLEEKEKREKDMLREIIEEAEQYKAEFYKKRSLNIENNKKVNREKEKLFLESQEKFHAEADKNYWKAIAELIPREVVAIEKRGKKDERKKPSINIIQGPKPGKPTDLSRMRQIVTKLKHNPPPHMKPKQPSQQLEGSKKDAKTGGSGSPSPPKAVLSASAS